MLTGYEKETIINFNEAEEIASIFTYNKVWQKHLEQKLGLKPVMENSAGGKEYAIPKKRIRPPRPPRQLSQAARVKAAAQLAQNRHLRSENVVPINSTETL
ncbi:MAG: hypothetical protein SVR04_10655 [Spirochaetota bacterium]|nr:hypothetical protein [Spirochaetota bacterium]